MLYTGLWLAEYANDPLVVICRCARTLVGGDSGGVHVAGISGGERRRLSIGCVLCDS
jgi:hypothetical protein